MESAKFLTDNGLVEIVQEGYTQAGGALRATMLGKAIVTSALSIDEGLFVHRELQRSMRGFILDDELVCPETTQVLTTASDLSLHSRVRSMSNRLEKSSGQIGWSVRD